MAGTSARRQSWSWILAGMVLVAAAALLIWTHREASRAHAPSAAVSPTAEPVSPESSPRTLQPAAYTVTGSPPPVPAAVSSVWRERMMDTRRGLLAKLKYAPGSVPLAGKTDLIPPHFVPPAERPLQAHKDPSRRGAPDDQPGDVRITQRQSTLFLAPGERAAASFEAMLPDGTHPPVTIGRAEMIRQPPSGPAEQPPPGPPVPVRFHDDGVAPDEQAGDGVYSAFVPPSVDAVSGLSGALVVEVDVSAAGETGTLTFRFAQTGSAPARFTQTARDVVEDGSLAIYVGIEVYHPGRYEIRGRLYDARNAPVAFVSFIDELSTDMHEVRLFTYGKLLRDEGAQPPFTLRDIEGWHYLLGQYPDRELMAMWEAGHETAAYSIDQFTDATWDSPEKRAKIESFDHAVHQTMTTQAGATAPRP